MKGNFNLKHESYSLFENLLGLVVHVQNFKSVSFCLF